MSSSRRARQGEVWQRGYLDVPNRGRRLQHPLQSPRRWSEPGYRCQITPARACSILKREGYPRGSYGNHGGRLTTDAEGSCKLAVIKAEAGKTYRLRFIGATALSTISVAIKDHDEFQVMELDGHYTQPAATKFVQIASGQRNSVLLRTKAEDEPPEDGTRRFYFQISAVGGPPSLTTYAVLQYVSGENDEEPDLTTIPGKPPLRLATLTDGWLDYTFQPHEANSRFPTAEDVTRRIVVNVDSNASDHIVYLQNGYDWIETYPDSPYLVDIYNGDLDLGASYQRAIDAGNAYDNETRLFSVKMGEVLEIVWQNQGSVDAGDVEHHPGVLVLDFSRC
ncbi:hypothetical protein PWT90_06467 [Aphanocladium album]|nr:hypothetical protein PWT90_06467 [Aphanocladium album]